MPAWLLVALANLVLAVAAVRGQVELVGAALVAIPVGLLVARRPQVAILGLIALIPFDGLLAVIPHPEIVQAWKEAVTVGAFAATFVAPHARATVARKFPDWFIALGGLVVIGALSAAYVGGITGLYGFKVYFFFALAIAVLWRCPFDERERDLLITILMVDGVITALFGVAQQLIGAERLHDFGYAYNDVIRFSGSFLRSFSTFDQPFGFGYFMMIVILLCLPAALADTTRYRNRMFLFLLPLLGLGLVTSLVRGAWLGVAVGILYLGINRHRGFLLAIPLGLVALLFLPADVAQSALSSTSSQERVDLWSTKVLPVLENPLGTGIGTSGSAAERVLELQGRRLAYFQPDNNYLLVAYELGLLGLWCYVALLITTFHAARSASFARAGPDAAFAAGTAALVLAIAAASVIATVFQVLPVDLIFWTCVAVVATTGTSTSATDVRQRVASMR